MVYGINCFQHILIFYTISNIIKFTYVIEVQYIIHNVEYECIIVSLLLLGLTKILTVINADSAMMFVAIIVHLKGHIKVFGYGTASKLQRGPKKTSPLYLEEILKFSSGNTPFFPAQIHQHTEKL